MIFFLYFDPIDRVEGFSLVLKGLLEGELLILGEAVELLAVEEAFRMEFIVHGFLQGYILAVVVFVIFDLVHEIINLVEEISLSFYFFLPIVHDLLKGLGLNFGRLFIFEHLVKNIVSVIYHLIVPT